MCVPRDLSRPSWLGWVVVTGEQQIDRKYLDALEQGTFWPTLAKWRTDNPSGVPDLSKAYLRNADLRGGDLSRTNLADADLTGAVLAGTNLSEADLRDATLVDANLSGANLQSANFSESCSTALAWCRPILPERDSRGLISAERI